MNQERLKEAQAYIGKAFKMSGRRNGSTAGLKVLYALAYAVNKAVAEPVKLQNGRAYCPACGSRLKLKNNYCSVCGQRVTLDKRKAR